MPLYRDGDDGCESQKGDGGAEPELGCDVLEYNLMLSSGDGNANHGMVYDARCHWVAVD